MTSIRKTSKFSAWEVDGLENLKSNTSKNLNKQTDTNTNKTAKPSNKDKTSSSNLGKPGAKKETGLSLSVKKNEDFSTWYTEVITRSEMIDYSDISGCYILRPWSYFIWETIQKWFDDKIRALGSLIL